MLKSYEELLVWQKAHKLVLSIYKITSEFPKEEQFGIVQQVRRSAYSVPANIAEGFERSHTKEFIRFVNIAKGSLSETKYFSFLAKDLGYLSKETYIDLVRDFDEIGKMLNGLITSLRAKV